MSLHMHCKRSKIFMNHDGSSAQNVKCSRNETTVAPDWVKDDPGYKNGIKDCSIIDLTPPKPIVAPAPAEPEAPAEDDAVEEGTGEEGEEQPADITAPSAKKLSRGKSLGLQK